MQQQLVDTAFAARQRFPGKPLRVWYVMLGPGTWRVVIINTATKARLAEGPIRRTRKAALNGLKTTLESAVRAHRTP